MTSVDPVATAVRAWTTPTTPPTARSRRPQRIASLPGQLLVFDCETTTDPAQALTFGAWRQCRMVGTNLATDVEGLFYADDFPDTDPAGFAALQDHARTQPGAGGRRLQLLSRSEFVERVFFQLAYRTRATVVGFNLPFDLSRLAIAHGDGRKANYGAFSLLLFAGKEGHAENKHRPRITIHHHSRHQAAIRFGKRLQPDDVDLIPEGSTTGKPDPTYVWPGRFVDLGSLAFALTGRSHSLASACDTFETTPRKTQADGHGRITAEYIDYCRNDVAATADLYRVLTAEFGTHPINVPVDRASSAAAIAKGYLRQMGITPPLEQNLNFPPEVLGHAMCAFYGGRAEAHIRRRPVPVANVDFTSMYPTVDSLLGLWGHLTAQRIEPVDITDELTELLAMVTLDACFQPGLWPRLVGIAEIDPADDIVPIRARFDTPASNSWNTAVTGVTSEHPTWCSVPDLIASTLLTGRPPVVRRAVRFAAVGKQSDLRKVKLRGVLTVDPATDDLWRKVIESRHRTPKDTALHQFLKLFANSGSFGIHAEFNAATLTKGEAVDVNVFGRYDEPFTQRVDRPEVSGVWCFPPFATVICGAARLMLAMLERAVTDLGGTWAFCDTDSMAIVASTAGGRVDGDPAIRALTIGQVDQIRQRFEQLNPYSGAIELLRVDQIADAYVISSKRYALFHRAADRIEIVKRSEHGLGHLLHPNPGGSDWISEFWHHEIATALGLPTTEPDWYDRPAVGRTHITGPHLLTAFRHINAGKPYRDQIKPFNFALFAAGAKPPPGTQPENFRLIGPYATDPAMWPLLRWVNLTDPSRTHRLTTRPTPSAALGDTYRSVLARHATYPETKSLGPDGQPCRRDTTGLLQRRHVQVATITHHGKDTNRIDHVAAGLVDRNDTRTSYGQGPVDLQLELILKAIRLIGASKIARAARITPRQISRLLADTGRPHPNTRRRLIEGIAAHTNGTDTSDTALWHAGTPT